MKIKRYFIILMNIFLLFLLFVVSSFAEETTNATASETVDAVFQWEVIDETSKKVRIISVNKDVTGELVVPAEIDGYKVTSIDKNAFSDCKEITSVIFNAQVNRMNTGMFENCISMETFMFNSDVVHIDSRVFYGCESLKEIIFPDSLRSIGIWSFAYCTSLENVVINEGFQDINTWAFFNCTALKSLIIPSSVNEIAKEFCLNCTSLETVTVDENNTYYINDEVGAVYKADYTSLIFYPFLSTVDTYKIHENVTSITSSDFEYAKNLKSLVIPDSVVSIATYAFKDSSLETLVIGKGLSKMNSRVFDGSALKYVEINSCPDDWENNVFASCKNLQTVVFNADVSVIPKSLFSGCNSLVNVEGLENVTEIRAGAFENCSSLVSVSGLSNVKKIGNSAFWMCASLKNIDAFSYVVEIDNYAFQGCKKLSVLPFGEKINIIGENSFYNCSSLTADLKLSSVESIGENAFAACSSLKSVELPLSISYLPVGVFSGCDAIISVVVPSNIRNIGNDCFSGTGITSLTLQNGLEVIGDRAFSDCPLTEINIPETVIAIGKNSFDNHRSKLIVIPENVQSIGSMAFNGKSEYTVYVYSPDCVYDENTCPYNRNSYYSTTTVYGYKGSSTESYIADCPTYSGEYHQHNYYDMCADAGLHKPAEKCADITTCIYCLETISGHADSDDDKICDDCGNSAELPSYTPDCSLSFSNGILTVSGTSIIDGDYEELLNEYSSVTETIVFNNGFVFVGENVFSDFSAVKFIFIPETMTVIGNNAFVDSSNIKSIVSFADELNIDDAFSSDSSFNLFNKAGSLISGTASLANINVLKHSFSNGILDFEGSLSSDLYDLFDVTTMFSLMYENILTLHFDHFEAVGFSVYSFDAEDYTPVDDSVFDNVDFTMYAFVNGEYTQISFNEMYLMSSEGYDGIFYLTTQTDDNIIHDDTQISIADRFNQAIERILSAIVRLFNKIFAFFSKLGR